MKGLSHRFLRWQIIWCALAGMMQGPLDLAIWEHSHQRGDLVFGIVWLVLSLITWMIWWRRPSSASEAR